MIKLQVWLYGPLARYAGDESQGSHAQLDLEVDEGLTVGGLLRQLGVPEEERGITFLNGELARLPGLDTDRDLELADGDRVGVFHPQSMWPFQYRFGSQMTSRLRETFRDRKDRGVQHAYTASSGT